MEDVEIELLIGLNCPSAVRPRDIICGNENEPYALRSVLGWHVNGPAATRAVNKYTVTEFRFSRAARMMKRMDTSLLREGQRTVNTSSGFTNV